MLHGIKDFFVKMEYKYNSESNTVTGIMKSTKKLKNTKVSWKLSEDCLTYTTTLKSNGSYTTTVEDLFGNKAEVLINVNQIDDKAPEITMEYIYNNNKTVTAIMHSNEILGDTKPSWTLSSDKLTYTKIFDSSQYYTTPVHDIYGNEVIVRISVKIYDGTIGDISGLNESKYSGLKEKLQSLKNKYQNWNIKILYTGLDWNTVIENEDAISGPTL